MLSAPFMIVSPSKRQFTELVIAGLEVITRDAKSQAVETGVPLIVALARSKRKRFHPVEKALPSFVAVTWIW